MPATSDVPAGLIVDYGGVLTNALQDCMRGFCESDGIDTRVFLSVLRDWLGDSAVDEVTTNPAHALERGEVQIPAFESQLAARLTTVDGRPVRAEGLLARMFAGFERNPSMVEVVRRARRRGIRTALLSNSWGMDYPREDWAELFDVVVISGEVGMRKPEPRIYRHTAALLGMEPARCVFVDDLTPNVRGAAAVGMVGVHHTANGTTVAELESLFGVPFGLGLPDDLRRRGTA